MTRSISPLSEAVPTPPARTTRLALVSSVGTKSSCATSAVLSGVGDGVGYCLDITRTVVTGQPEAEFLELFGVLHFAQAAAVAAAVVGTPCEQVDRAGRELITAAGYGECFNHRIGHGIGIEEHEDPYIVAGNPTPLVAGHAFSVEPGIYLRGRFGARIEDIVIATEDGPLACNQADHGLAVVEA